MSDQPVTPDREALTTRVYDQLLDVLAPVEADLVSDVAVRALLPLLTEALDRARQQGRDEAAAAIEASPEGRMQFSEYYPNGLHIRYGKGKFAEIARGGPNRKDEE